jgi:hypothetical protein
MMQQVSPLLHRYCDPPQRIEHLSGGRLHPRGVHHPQGATPRPPSDLSAHVLPGDLVSPLKHRVVSSPVAWQSRTHTRPSSHLRSPGPFISYATTHSTHRELTLASESNFTPTYGCQFLFHSKITANQSRRMLLFYTFRN